MEHIASGEDLSLYLEDVSPIVPIDDDVISAIPTTAPVESEEELKTRFQVELEFVLCLANPNYLNFLAQRDYFKKATFINYLKYLLYWKRPEYAKYLKYPQCLHFLELLQEEKFRDALANSQNAKFIEDQQILQWQYYVRKRMRLQHIPPSDDTPTSSSA